MTILLASHDPQIAARSERLIRLRDGAVIDDIQLTSDRPAQDIIRHISQLGLPAHLVSPARPAKPKDPLVSEQLGLPYQARAQAQYFGPTNSSSRATASPRATEMTLRREKRHATPS